MSRRHHGRPHHARNRTDAPRQTGPAGADGTPGPTVAPTPDARRGVRAGSVEPVARTADQRPVSVDGRAGPDARGSSPTVLPGERFAPRSATPDGPLVPARPADTASAADRASTASPPFGSGEAREPAGPGASAAPSQPVAADEQARDHGAGPANGCTAPQLRRFIKSRPYVPMHELRRRFGIVGTDDDVTQVRLDHQAIYVGLPPREGALLGDLLRGGEIGCELSLDPRTPVVIGVYPMRPVPRG